MTKNSAMQPKRTVIQQFYPINRFFDLFTVEIISKFMYYRKSQLKHTVFQTEDRLIIIYQNNELNIKDDRKYLTVQWWEGYHRFNGQPHPDFPLTQIKRAYYHLHDKTEKVYRTSLPEESFHGQELSLISEATNIVISQFCRQRAALHISLWQHPK